MAGNCTCDGECPGVDCTCIHVIGPPTRCTCKCPHCDVGVSDPIYLEAADRIGIDVHGKELGALAEIIQEVTSADVLVPVARLRSSITMRIEDATFAEAVETLGLGLRSPQDTAA